MSKKNKEIVPVCPACLRTNTVQLVNLGDEEDSDGTFGNYFVECTCCGRRTEDMDTPEDAIEAWEDPRCSNVYYADADTVLLKYKDAHAAGFTLEDDLRQRLGAFED